MICQFTYLSVQDHSPAGFGHNIFPTHQSSDIDPLIHYFLVIRITASCPFLKTRHHDKAPQSWTMRLGYSIILALSTDVFSLPNPASSTSLLNIYGWIGSFAADDSNCTKGPYGGKWNSKTTPDLKHDCHNWENKTPQIGYGWGSGDYMVLSITFYANVSCDEAIMHPVFNPEKKHQSGGCFPISQQCDGSSAKGGPCHVQSVGITWEGDATPVDGISVG